MWLNLVCDHKILDIEKIPEKTLIFRQKSVDKLRAGLLYYSSTHPENIPLQKDLETFSKNF